MISFKKLFKNQHGFSHHLIVPIVIIGAITLIGGYVLKQSRAASVPNPYTCPAPQPQLAGFDSDAPGHYCVHYLQFVLKNYAGQALTVNGSFDQATVNAVKNVQTFTGLVADGIVGTQTWPVINDLNAKNNTTTVTDTPPPPPPSSATFYYYSSGIKHNTGNCVLRGLDCAGTGWEWNYYFDGDSANDSTTTFMQYGPYKDMTVPAGKRGFQVCHYYTKNGGTVYSDVTFNNTGTRHVVGQFNRSNVTECNNVPLNPGIYRSMEFRFKVTSGSTGTVVRLSSTTVRPY